ncbi:MAG: HAMP domain-containing histidine kinase [Promicromonosporaceae bacterium]|nr:HAMP domain-containing histidine kinase [Promicromonosporaceae bacterium]
MTRDWTLRSRLTAFIALVFIIGGAILIISQFFIVDYLLSRPVNVDEVLPQVPILGFGEVATIRPVGDLEVWTSNAIRLVTDTTIVATDRHSANVVHALVGWSLAILAAFTALAVVAANWLARRSLNRVAAITTAAQGITHSDLAQRLNVMGPNDEVKELGDSLDSMLDRIQAAFERQDQFIAGASHELRTPLTTTRTMLEIPLAQGRVPVDLEPNIQAALAANHRSEELISALLMIARMPGADSIPAEHIYLPEFAVQIETEFGPGLSARELTIRTKLEPALALVNLDLLLLAVTNLMENATKYAESKIGIVTGITDGSAWIEILNDGPLVTEAEVAAWLQPFQRGAQSRLAGGGLGLGLALVTAAAKGMGGQLSLTPRPQGGVTARLSLPTA